MKPTATAIAAALAFLVAAGSASADPRWRDDRRGDRDGVAAGIAGFAIGAIVGSAISDGRPVVVDYGWQPPRDIRHVPRHSRAPRVREGNPWTRSWYRYCEQRYRTFDRRSGTFGSHGGRSEFCVMPTRFRGDFDGRPRHRSFD